MRSREHMRDRRMIGPHHPVMRCDVIAEPVAPAADRCLGARASREFARPGHLAIRLAHGVVRDACAAQMSHPPVEQQGLRPSSRPVASRRPKDSTRLVWVVAPIVRKSRRSASARGSTSSSEGGTRCANVGPRLKSHKFSPLEMSLLAADPPRAKRHHSPPLGEDGGVKG
jgi:hypothetical protein